MFYSAERIMVASWDGEQVATCPVCNASLVAKRGDVISWHWAHYPNVDGREPCPYQESIWHMRWKDIYLSIKGWQVEAPVKIKGKQYFLDAYNANQRKVKEFVHSLSPYYLKKHQDLVNYGLDVEWIFDGAEFSSLRAFDVRKDGKKRLMKERAFRVADFLDPTLIHLVESNELYTHYQNNVWFPKTGNVYKFLLKRYLMLCRGESLDVVSSPVSAKPLPSLYKALPGYKCMVTTCTNALVYVDKRHVECKDGHLFASGGVYASVDELPDPEVEVALYETM